MDTSSPAAFDSKQAPRVPLWLGALGMVAVASTLAWVGGRSKQATVQAPASTEVRSLVQATPVERPTATIAGQATEAVWQVEESLQTAQAEPTERVAALEPVQRQEAVASELFIHANLPAGMSDEQLDGIELRYGFGAEDDTAILEHSAELGFDGSVGPIALESDVAGLHLRLDGGGLIPTQGWYSISGGPELVVELAPELGSELWFFVADATNGQGLPAAELVLEVQEGVSPRPNIQPRDDGFVRFEGVPSGSVFLTTSADGFATRRDGPFEVPGPAEVTHIELLPGAGLEGRVTALGSPVTDFTITWWSAGSASTFVQQGFEERQGGEFELLDVVAGPLYISAASSEYPPSAPVLFDPTVEFTPLEIELALGETLTGRIVAGVQGDPVSKANLVLATGEGAQAASSWGPRFQVQSDGRFEIANAPLSGVLRIDSEGFSLRSMSFDRAPGEATDLGDIVLNEPAPLAIFLEGVRNPSDFAVEGIHGVALPYGYFDEFGEIAYPDNQAEDIHLQVTAPDGSYLFVSRTFQPGTPAELPIQLGRHSLALSLEDTGQAEGPFQANLELPIGTLVYPFEASREVTFRFLQEGSFSLSISDAKGALVATQNLEILPGTNQARISLDSSKKVARVRYQGEPLAGAEVFLFRDGEDLPLYKGTSGPLGKLAVRTDHLASHAQLAATVDHPRLGVDSAARVRTNADGEIEIVPAFDASLELTLMDGLRPLPSLEVRLQNASGSVLFSHTATSDTQGQAQWSSVGEGEYRVTVLHAEYWPAQAELEPGQHTLQVRQLGDLEITVQSASGVSLGGEVIQIFSEEFQVPVSAWAQAGVLQASDPELRTDAGGLVWVRGLPHGSYRVLDSQGRVLADSLIVAPGITTRAAY